MKTLFLECNMGAAGDMLFSALLELIPDQADFLARFNALGIPGVHAEAVPSQKCGLNGTHTVITVYGEEEHSHDAAHTDAHIPHTEADHEHTHEHHHEHHHTTPNDIYTLVDSLPISEGVRNDAKAVYKLIAEAESSVHGVSVSDIHFHEVGTMDAVADVVGVCMLIEQLSPDEILASPVHVGSGNVHCAHGILPVPAPATALLLTGIPAYGGNITGELCTPTGAALLKHFVSKFGNRPMMTVEKIGCGMGSKDFPQANCVRAFFGETSGKLEEIVRLECNLDDMTGEETAYAFEVLFKAGARDVYTQPIGMKKNRPGILLSVICMPEDANRLAELMLKHTSTLGVRRLSCSRYILDRSMETVATEYGDVRVKISEGAGIVRKKPEYEDIAAIARKYDLPIAEVELAVKKAIR